MSLPIDFSLDFDGHLATSVIDYGRVSVDCHKAEGYDQTHISPGLGDIHSPKATSTTCCSTKSTHKDRQPEMVFRGDI